MTNNPCVVVGVTGGIAAYKICTLVSSLHKQGMEVHVLMTKEAQEFITPLTMQSLSGQKVITDMFSVDYTPDVHHISLAQKADVFVIAPATANVIAKVANGIADDMLTTTFLASTCEKLIVPAMNTAMLENPITQDNLKKCASYGMHILESGTGYLACGTTGKGRMPEASEIEDAVKELLVTDKYLHGKKVLITAGPTCEAIDPVRYITNHSSGKMGYALARAARNAGAEVTLVTGKTNLADLRGVHMIPVTSAKDMAEAVLPLQQDMDLMILAAAVADYTPSITAEEKIHKSEGGMTLELERTTDILKTLGSHKPEGQILVGFSMETEHLIENSQRKLTSKNCDFIIANSIREAGAGFAGDTNIVTVISKQDQKELGLLSKDETAEQILRLVTRRVEHVLIDD
ncbi:MAG: bifunctional phosphopantothenoylcysteine decarboxylase/phosphopantothenate--cysteine ligase CoaBC [Solobacterium sp.]|nr:bifunctional phosphopantothenoylcysteine decarboxylase/phosphopantothenate--cysteine ligase CoaBC [Solobacterium sp.]